MLEAHAQRGRSQSTTRGTADSAVVRVQPPPQPTPQQHPARTVRRVLTFSLLLMIRFSGSQVVFAALDGFHRSNPKPRPSLFGEEVVRS